MKRLRMAAVVFWVLGFVSASVEAGSYSYTLIAQTGGTFTNLDTAPTLNNVGTVAFHATYTAGGDGIFVGGGGALKTIADTNTVIVGPLFDFQSNPSINDYGTVAFVASHPYFEGCTWHTMTGIMIGSGAQITQLYGGYPPGGCDCGGECYGGTSDWTSPSINNHGTIAFTYRQFRYAEPSLGLVVSGNGGPLTTMFSSLDTYAWPSPFQISINDAGTVAFTTSGGCCPPADGNLFTGDGGTLTFIGTSAVGGYPAINNAGVVAFLAGDGSYYGTGTNIVLGNGGPLITAVGTNSSYSSFLGNVSINDYGTVAFNAALYSGVNGIFTGPDATANRIISIGDSLFGSTVTGLSFGNKQLNNSGAVAFGAGLADGRQVVVRADPNPSPMYPSINLIDSNVIFAFATTQSVLYAVQSTTDLVSGAWSTIASNIVGTGGPVTYIDLGAANVPQRFYRAGTSGLIAFDNAGDAMYTNGWNGGSTGGIGFGPWTLTATGVIGSTSNGFFVASSTNNAFGTSPGIDTAGKSWGIYANGGNFTAAYRAFAAPLPVGGTFRIDMDTGLIDAGNSLGFVLRNGNASSSPGDYNVGARFEFLFLGGGSSYAVVDAAGYQTIGVPFTGTGLRLVFTLNTANTYTLLTIDNASSATNTFTGTLAGSGTLDSLAAYNRNAGSNPDHDAYFNSLQILSP